MPAFRYQHGDRPLDGFTIEHGVGRGGFGEVYYALSDSGRQVALKAVQNYEEVELRGIGHCMNLKSPYLVSIFDVKRSADGDPFVIMEFIGGPSLRQLLDESPEGLGTAKAAFFLREIGKGLAYLHDCGIVHRDLKPHNVFYEEGFVKIGDYSLSKVISTSHRSGHTMTVGTVHYMAPEIGMGRYDHTVDIYALGVMLFEMLTGHPPFEGESVGEVLMKHMASEVDVSGIEEPFASVIKKAMAKDPADRYPSAEAMVEAVYGAEHVQNSVTAFNPKSLSIVAGKAAEKVPGGVAVATAPYTPPGLDRDSDRPAGRSKGFAYHAGRAAAQFGSSVGVTPLKWPKLAGSVDDPLNHKRRTTLGLISLVVFALGMYAMTDGFRTCFGHGGDAACVLVILSMAAICFGVVVARRRILPRIEDEASLTYRLVVGGTASVCAVPFAMALSDEVGRQANVFATLGGVLLPMFLLDWRIMTMPIRPKRVLLAPVLLAAAIASVGALLLGGHALLAFGMAAGVAMTVQIASPFDPVAAARYRPKLAWWNSLGRALDSAGQEMPDVADDAPEMPLEPANVVGAPPTSPHLRLATLILGLLPFCGIPVAGLHRFYVGKIGTGILWLLTFGLFYIGQLVDLVLIVLGQFRDSNERLVTEWTGTNDEESHAEATAQLQATPVNHYSSVPAPSRAPLRLGSLFLNMLGGLLLVMVLVLGLVLAVDIPAALAAGVFDFDPVNLHAAIEFVDPLPRVVRVVGWCLTVSLGMFATICLLTARRGLGVIHMLRVLISAVGISLALLLVHVAFDFGNWDRIGMYLQENQFAPAVDTFLNRGPAFFAPMIIAVVAFVGACFVLAWPARAPAATRPAAQPQAEVAGR